MSPNLRRPFPIPCSPTPPPTPLHPDPWAAPLGLKPILSFNYRTPKHKCSWLKGSETSVWGLTFGPQRLKSFLKNYFLSAYLGEVVSSLWASISSPPAPRGCDENHTVSLSEWTFSYPLSLLDGGPWGARPWSEASPSPTIQHKGDSQAFVWNAWILRAVL